MSDGQIVFEVTADGKHAIADIREITRAIQQESGKWDNAAKQATGGIENAFSGMLKKIVAGFSAAKIGQLLLNIGQDAIQAASDLEEVQNVVDVTFGESAGAINKWAKNAIQQFGLTETQAKRFASTMGAMLKSSGISGDEIQTVSTDLAGLAADMASFYNLDFDSAFQKIRSGISGQTMPLKELGIDMSVANMQAFALQKGITKTWDSMSQGEQVMLRYQYLMSVTSDAQGDFARTQDGYANSVRLLQSNLESLKATLGKAFIDVVTNATGFLNDFIKLLMPDESKKTVLEDFAEIDLQTEEKLSKIRETAAEANGLVDTLVDINNNKTKQAAGAVQGLADDLSNINFDQGKVGLFSDFIAVLGQNIPLLSGLTGQSADGVRTWLAEIAAGAETLDPNDAAGWTSLMTSIKEGLPGLENTEFGKEFFAAMGENMEGVSGKISVYDWAIDTLGAKTNRTREEQALWLEICKRLIHTIPGLSSIINAETGEIKGGTAAVKEYIETWENGQKFLTLKEANSKKYSAIQEKKDELAGLEADMMIAKGFYKRANDQYNRILKEKGVTDELIEKYYGKDADKLKIANDLRFQWRFNLSQEDLDLIREEAKYARDWRDTMDDATEAFNNQNDALKEALETQKQEEAMLKEQCGVVDQTAEAWDGLAGSINGAVEGMKANFAELFEYMEQVRQSTEESINNTVKGFEKLESPMEKQRNKIQSWKDELADLQSQEKSDDRDKKIKSLQEKIKSAEGEPIISTHTMKEGLKSQADWMDKYMENMRAARNLGVKDEVLAYLSDGSAESYDYLEALAHGTTQDAEDINNAWESVIEKKKEMSAELTDQKLTVDETYQGMAEKAKEAVAELDLEEQAKENSGKTVAGITAGINEQLPGLETAIAAVVSAFGQLGGLSFSFGGGSGGGGGFDGNYATPLAKGMDYVPYDNFYARLHAGEAVLTAEENKVWQGIKNGSFDRVDYESLGGVMRDNVKPGGNVYLDGKIVGSVVSDRQGRAYKSLQRSGWQA